MQIKEITYGTAEYQSLLNFRYLYLRKPLGLNWSHDDLLDESKQIHLGLINNKKIIGCCVTLTSNCPPDCKYPIVCSTLLSIQALSSSSSKIHEV